MSSTDRELAELIEAAIQGDRLGLLRHARALADQLSAGAPAPADPRR